MRGGVKRSGVQGQPWESLILIWATTDYLKQNQKMEKTGGPFSFLEPKPQIPVFLPSSILLSPLLPSLYILSLVDKVGKERITAGHWPIWQYLALWLPISCGIYFVSFLFALKCLSFSLLSVSQFLKNCFILANGISNCYEQHVSVNILHVLCSCCLVPFIVLIS